MNWLDKIKCTVKKTAEVTYDKSGQLVDIAKLKFSITTAEAEADKLYKELGILCYNEKKGEGISDELKDAAIKNIEEKLSEIANLKAELKQIKKVKSCTKCGKELAEENTFCSNCGEKCE